MIKWLYGLPWGFPGLWVVLIGTGTFIAMVWTDKGFEGSDEP